jgi:hypothetical protein
VGQALGVARIDGESSDPSARAGRVTGAWAAPYALIGVRYAVTAAFGVDARAEAGWVLLPVTAEVARAKSVEVRGLWSNVQVGASLAF